MQKPPAKNNLFISNPVIAKEWHPTKNGALTPKDVTIHSNRKVWWLCANDHVWPATINERIHGKCCPYCAGVKSEDENFTIENEPPQTEELLSASDENSAETDVIDTSQRQAEPDDSARVFDQSLAKEWHPEKNANLQIWWLCPNGHEWTATVPERLQGMNCPYCSDEKTEKETVPLPDQSQTEEKLPVKEAGPTRKETAKVSKDKVTAENCLQAVNPGLAGEWHPTKNGILTPQDVSVYSGRKVWWKCSKGHEWQASVSARNKGQGCFYCSYMQRGKRQ